MGRKIEDLSNLPYEYNKFRVRGKQYYYLSEQGEHRITGGTIIANEVTKDLALIMEKLPNGETKASVKQIKNLSTEEKEKAYTFQGDIFEAIIDPPYNDGKIMFLDIGVDYTGNMRKLVRSIIKNWGGKKGKQFDAHAGDY